MTRSVTPKSRLKISKQYPARYQHDCDQCKYRGQLEEFDIYTCKDTVIARFGSECSEYWSSDLYCFRPEYWLVGNMNNDKVELPVFKLVLLRELHHVGALQVTITM